MKSFVAPQKVDSGAVMMSRPSGLHLHGGCNRRSSKADTTRTGHRQYLLSACGQSQNCLRMGLPDDCKQATDCTTRTDCAGLPLLHICPLFERGLLQV